MLKKLFLLLLFVFFCYGSNLVTFSTVTTKNTVIENVNKKYNIIFSDYNNFVKKNYIKIKNEPLLNDFNKKLKILFINNTNGINEKNIDKILNLLGYKNDFLISMFKTNFELKNYLKLFEYYFKLNLLSDKLKLKYLKTVGEIKILYKNNICKNKKCVNFQNNKNLIKIENENILKKLQYYYLKVEILTYKKVIKFLNNKKTLLKNFLINNFKKTNLNKSLIKGLNKELTIYQNLLNEKKREYEKLYTNYQRWNLLNNKENLKIIEKYIKINLNKQLKYLKKIILINMDKWIIDYNIKIKNNNINLSKLIKEDKKLLNIAKYIDKIRIELNLPFENLYQNNTKKILVLYEKNFLGLKYYVYVLKTDKNKIKNLINLILNYSLYTINGKSITPLKILLFFIFFLIGFIIGKFYKKTILKLRDKYNLNYSNAIIFANLGNYSIIIVFFIIGLKTIGLDLTSLSIIIGALSVGIGFGLQTIINNFVSGLILMFEKTLKIGDYVEVGNIRGTIKDISMRSIIIKTNDNIDIIIPNKNFIENNVINWTLGDKIVRFKIPFSVAYGTDIEKMEKILLENLENEITKYCQNIKILKNHKYYNVKPIIVFVEMADSSLNFELYIWLYGEAVYMPNRTVSCFLKYIYNKLNENNIIIPFPQQDIYIKELPELKIKNELDNN